MKYFALLVICSMTILHTNQIYSLPEQRNQAQQSLTAYLYSYIMKQKVESSIPAAIDTKKKVIIFDLDGVLCKTNDLQALYEIGIPVSLQYLIMHGKPSTEKLFEALQKTPATTKFKAYNEGLMIPQIMVDWLTNMQEIRDVQNSMIHHILESNKTIIEKNFFINTVLMMTTPEKFVATRQIIPDAISLARKLKDLGYKIYILSNWDAPSFGIFQEKFPELFLYQDKQLFDGIMISGKTGMLKPNQDFFELFLKKFNIKKSHAIFIDDTKENIEAAKNLNIKSIHCKNNDIAQVGKELIDILKL